MREMKTGKQKRIQITARLRRELKWYIENMKDHEYLIKSRQGKNRPIGRSMAYKILSSTATEFGLDEIEHIHYVRHSDIICTCRLRI